MRFLFASRLFAWMMLLLSMFEISILNLYHTRRELDSSLQKVGVSRPSCQPASLLLVHAFQVCRVINLCNVQPPFLPVWLFIAPCPLPRHEPHRRQVHHAARPGRSQNRKSPPAPHPPRNTAACRIGWSGEGPAEGASGSATSVPRTLQPAGGDHQAGYCLRNICGRWMPAATTQLTQSA